MSDHLDLVDKTRHLENEFQLVKEELSELRNASPVGRALRFESGREKFQVPIHLISYLKAAGNYVEINAGDKPHMVYGSLSELEERLADENFVRIHRSYIVNLDKILRINGREVHLNNAVLPVGATHKQRLIEKWNHFR